MSPRLLADAVLVFHALFIAFAVLGGLIALLSAFLQRGKAHRLWLWLHLTCATWAATVVIMGWTCPLTPMENRFRVAGYGSKYEGGFVHHYIGPLVYPGGMPRRLEWVAGVSIAQRRRTRSRK